MTIEYKILFVVDSILRQYMAGCSNIKCSNKVQPLLFLIGNVHNICFEHLINIDFNFQKTRVAPQLFLYYQMFQILLNTFVFIVRFMSVWSLLAFIVNVTNLYFYAQVKKLFKKLGGTSIFNICGCT